MKYILRVDDVISGKMAAATGLQISERVLEISRHRRVNKHKKKNWRKYSDVRDVEEFLDDVRLQERTVGGLVREKRDDEIFFVDKRKKRKGGKLKNKPLKIDTLLRPNSMVKPPINVQSHQVQNGRKLRRHFEMQARLHARGLLLRRRKQNLPLSKPLVKEHVLEKDFYDLWDDSGPLVQKFIGQDPWYLEKTMKKPPKTPALRKLKPSGLVHVEVPHPGCSYNPSFEHHQDVLREAHLIEVKKLQENEKLQKKVQLPQRKQLATEESHHMEIIEGLVQESDEEEEEEEEVVVVEEVVARSVSRDDKKTKQQRRKEREIKAELRKRAEERTVLLRKQDLFRLRAVRKEVEVVLHNRAILRQRRRLKCLQQVDQPRRLGPFLFQEPDIDVKLTSELRGSLLELKPEGNLLKDRFKSFQRRNIIEPRQRAKLRRKYKVKFQEKRAYREITL
uniref:Ribosome biogenesis protein NOP53 n=1 Tax=Eptatretus burgeri TaxID=7764 RepID=A0A8C4WYZ9_EPTBU